MKPRPIKVLLPSETLEIESEVRGFIGYEGEKPKLGDVYEVVDIYPTKKKYGIVLMKCKRILPPTNRTPDNEGAAN
jgi:hypothetical protein